MTSIAWAAAHGFCTTNPGALTEAPTTAHRIERCIECGHTHWTTEMQAAGVYYCDQCYDAELALDE